MTKEKIKYFDPLGKDPSFQTMQKLANLSSIFKLEIEFNKEVLQHDSFNCGIYVSWFIISQICENIQPIEDINKLRISYLNGGTQYARANNLHFPTLSKNDWLFGDNILAILKYFIPERKLIILGPLPSEGYDYEGFLAEHFSRQNERSFKPIALILNIKI